MLHNIFHLHSSFMSHLFYVMGDKKIYAKDTPVHQVASVSLPSPTWWDQFLGFRWTEEQRDILHLYSNLITFCRIYSLTLCYLYIMCIKLAKLNTTTQRILPVLTWVWVLEPLVVKQNCTHQKCCWYLAGQVAVQSGICSIDCKKALGLWVLTS